MRMDSAVRSEISVREATSDDVDSVVRLIRQLGDDSEITEAYVLQYLSGMDRKILLAQDTTGKVSGLLSYSVRADLYHAGNSVLIEELVVDQDVRGSGIGSALMEMLMRRLQDLECKELCLAVMPDNEGAVRFYRRHGLVEEALFLERHFSNNHMSP